MNQGLKILLEGEGFRQFSKQSCKFTRRVEQSEIKSFVHHVWLHRHGGQAEVYDDESGKRLARLEKWQSIDDLKEFFKDYHGDII